MKIRIIRVIPVDAAKCTLQVGEVLEARYEDMGVRGTPRFQVKDPRTGGEILLYSHEVEIVKR